LTEILKIRFAVGESKFTDEKIMIILSSCSSWFRQQKLFGTIKHFYAFEYLAWNKRDNIAEFNFAIVFKIKIVKISNKLAINSKY
jgi:hypothetical protein